MNANNYFFLFSADAKPRNYQESNYPCSSISISRILDTSDLSWRRELGLWSPAYNTFRIIGNIRYVPEKTRLKTLQSKLPDKTTRLKIQRNHKKLNRTLRNLNKTQNLKKPY